MTEHAVIRTINRYNVRHFRWGIFGTGPASLKFAAGLRQLGDAEVAMVASRSAAQARAFAESLNIPHAIDGYDAAAAVASGLVDAVYIATPPALHREHAVACLAAGVATLIEKPFASDAVSARAIAAIAEDARVFCMEAMWTRFMPAAARLRALVDGGAVGEPHVIASNFGISNAVDPAYGNFDPARGGGALAHLGVYPVSLGQWLFGTPVEARAVGRVGETGVEEDAAIALRYVSGVVGSFHASLRAPGSNGLVVHGRMEASRSAVRFIAPGGSRVAEPRRGGCRPPACRTWHSSRRAISTSASSSYASGCSPEARSSGCRSLATAIITRQRRWRRACAPARPKVR